MPISRIQLLFSLGLLYSNSVCLAGDAIYKCKDQYDKLHYQTTPCAEEVETVATWANKKTAPKTLVLSLGEGGHYYSDGLINDTNVTFLVDTGASFVALPRSIAQQAQLRCDRPVMMDTANGRTAGCAATVDKLRFGEFVVENVTVVVHTNLSQPLLGMDVLKQFKITQSNNQLSITEH